MKSILIFLLAFVIVPIETCSQPKREVRSVWLTTLGGLDWPHSYATTAENAERQKAELCSILDRLQRANINVVLFQTRIRATVIYPSAIEPWDACLTGKPGVAPSYDPLAFAVEQCHKRGMELHAWVVAMPVGKWNGAGCLRLRKRHPSLVKKIGADGYLNPEKRETADYLSTICDEIVSNYDVDGIHLDYIRYPEKWQLKVTRQQGRDNITSIVRSIYLRVKSRKPWVKISCSPVGKHDDLSRFSSNGWNAYSRVCQDAQGWLREGIMDMLFPMMYFRDNQFYPFAFNWAEQSCGRIVASGLGIYFMSPQESNWSLDDVTRQLQVVRSLGMGHAYFRSKFLTDNLKGIYDYVENEFCRYPALVPAIEWESTEKPAAPFNISRQEYCEGVATLSWSHADEDSTMTMFNVYSSREYPVDTDDARNLFVTRLQAKSVHIPSDEHRYYAVTAMNRYGNESTPLQETCPQEVFEDEKISDRFLECDGQLLRLPPKSSVLSADHLTIETVQGRIVATFPYTRDTYDVSSLAEGVYVVRSLGRKGVNHKLGWFAIRRSF